MKVNYMFIDIYRNTVGEYICTHACSVRPSSLRGAWRTPPSSSWCGWAPQTGARCNALATARSYDPTACRGGGCTWQPEKEGLFSIFVQREKVNHDGLHFLTSGMVDDEVRQLGRVALHQPVHPANELSLQRLQWMQFFFVFIEKEIIKFISTNFAL